jgi:hypothetical protein
MQSAWQAQHRQALTAADLEWRVRPIALPARHTAEQAQLQAVLADATLPFAQRVFAARDLVFQQRLAAGGTIPLSCLRLGSARLLHLPAELFIEYQLAAQQMRPNDFIAVAAYGDNAPGYIGTEIAYSQGGYEVEHRVSRVAPSVEPLLTAAMRELLQVGA